MGDSGYMIFRYQLYVSIILVLTRKLDNSNYFSNQKNNKGCSIFHIKYYLLPIILYL